MNIFNVVSARINLALKELLADHSEIRFSVERPANAAHGDLATNAAMTLTKLLGQRPQEIAANLVRILQKDIVIVDLIERFTVAAPGFINFHLKKEVLHSFLKELNLKGLQAFNDDINIGRGKKINIEFVSANPTGPMHIGHARSAIYGDITCRLLKQCGFDVTSEYYINDAGMQVEKLLDSLYARYRQLCGENLELPVGGYPGEYLVDAAKKLQEKYGTEVTRDNPSLKDFAIKEMMSLIKSDLHKLGVKHDIFTSEAQLIRDGLVEKAIALLEAKGLMYHGILEPPKSAHDTEWEKKEQYIFKSTAFGDDLDRVVLKNDGSYSYFASDLALHMDKLNRGYDELFLVLGADHAGYVTRIKASVRAMTDNKKDLHVIINQLVNIYKDGQQIKMSKRKGNFLTVDDVLDEMDPAILRFAMLSQKNETVLDIDCDALLAQSKDNQLFYIQYAHTRIASIIESSYKNNIFSEDEISIREENNTIQYKFAPKSPIDYSSLQSELDLSIIKYLMNFARLLEIAATHKEPHRISYYLYDLANKLHTLWHAGVVEHNMRCVMNDQIILSRARISLIYSVALVICIGLDIMGIQPLLKM